MDSLNILFADSPFILWIQIALLTVVLLDVYLIFFVTRDILLRTTSFALQMLMILLVTVFPVIGFLVYLLLRPSQTLKERELERLVRSLLQKERKQAVHEVEDEEEPVKPAKEHKKDRGGERPDPLKIGIEKRPSPKS